MKDANVRSVSADNDQVPPQRQSWTPDGDSRDIGLRDIFGAVLRRKHILLSAVVAAPLLVAVVLTQITPLYSAQTFILIQPEQSRTGIVEAAVDGVGGDREAVKSETYVLASTALAHRVVGTLDLGRDREFNHELRGPSAFAQLMDRVGINLASASTTSKVPKPSLTDAMRQSRIVEQFKKALTVAPVEESRVISVQFLATEARKAQTIANTIAEQYLTLRQEAKAESTHELSGWLGEQIDELRTRVQEGETAIEELRRKYGLVEDDDGDLQDQELAQVNTQKVMARASRAEAEARLDKITALLETPGGVQSASEVLNSPVIQNLHQEETQLKGAIAELSPELGDKHPRMVRLRAQAQDLQQKIQGEMRKIIVGLGNEVDVARAREASLDNALRDIKARISASNGRRIELRSLEREVEANRGLLINLLNRETETRPQNATGFPRADARIISKATLPTEPSYPDKAFILSLTFVAAALLGSLLILLLELLDNGFRSVEQLEAQTDARGLGFVPLAKFGKSSNEAAYVQANPASAFAESIRTLHWSLKLEFGDRHSKVILVTSAQSGEGKTTICNSLASTQGSVGKRVLVIDADVRRPALHERLGRGRAPGLADFLSGSKDIDEILIDCGDAQCVSAITAGDGRVDVQSLLASDRMRQLLDDLRPRYDLIVIDSPPVLVGADSLLLARVSDVTVLVVQWGKTQRQVVKLALERLRSAGAVRRGSLLSQVHAKKYAQYAYGDSGAYAGELAKYYVGG